MRRLRQYLPLALLLAFVLGNRPQCERRVSSETYAPMALRVPGGGCAEVFDPTGQDWADLASATLADTLESLWLRVERRPTGNRMFVCASDRVPLHAGLRVPIEVVRTTGETGSASLTLATGNPVEATVWSDPPALAVGDTAQLHIDVRGGDPPYTYRWVGNVSDPAIADPTTFETGRFYVWVFDSSAGGEIVPLHYAFTVLDVLTTPERYATATPGTIDPGGSARLNLSPPPQSAWWSPNTSLDNPYALNPVATPAYTTKYTARAIYPDGPMSLNALLTVRLRISVTANPQWIQPGQYSVIRVTREAGGQQNLGRYSYAWSPSEDVDHPYGPSSLARPTQTTTYKVVVIDEFGQMATDSVIVVVTP